MMILLIYLYGCLITIITWRIVMNKVIKNWTVDTRDIVIMFMLTLMSYAWLLVMITSYIAMYCSESDIDWNTKIF